MNLFYPFRERAIEKRRQMEGKLALKPRGRPRKAFHELGDEGHLREIHRESTLLAGYDLS